MRGLLIFLFILLSVFMYYQYNTAPRKYETETIHELGEREMKNKLKLDSLELTKYKIILIIKPNDFNCQRCFNNFVEFNDSLKGSPNKAKQVLCFLVSEGAETNTQMYIAQKWKSRYQIEYNVYPIDSLNVSLNIKYSSFLLRKEDKFIVHRLPLEDFENKRIHDWIQH